MLKKAMAAAAVAASVVGAASPAMAIGNDDGTKSASGNGAHSAFGNSVTKGDLSPQATLVQSTANKLCVGLPAKANLQAIVGLIAAVGVAQDVPILSAPQNQQCAENSTQAKGDEPLSHILDDISALSGNGAGNR
ncbi:rodlin [Streptomyces sp. NBC_00490]|uniref:rodlin n=1 Tax=Streptomyces sp. NBC_00490 TaxID=2903657 RepID=UPI002E1913B9